MSRNPLQDVEQLFCSVSRACDECCVVRISEVVEGLVLAVQPRKRPAVSCEFPVHIVHNHTVNYEKQVW